MCTYVCPLLRLEDSFLLSRLFLSRESLLSLPLLSESLEPLLLSSLLVSSLPEELLEDEEPSLPDLVCPGPKPFRPLVKSSSGKVSAGFGGLIVKLGLSLMPSAFLNLSAPAAYAKLRSCTYRPASVNERFLNASIS